jgi:hypothetical protein
MASEVATYKKIVTDGVLAAVGSVPRHLFLPGVSLERAYGLGTVVTHRDARGVALSSASGLGIVVAMLTQLDPRPGQRVLEVGAGTGYNAALLRHIVGPQGSVTTVDIFADAATEARDHLAAAGYGDVTVVCGDGQVGEHNLAVRGETGVVLRTDGGDPLDAVALKDVLEGPATVVWTGVTSPDGAFSDLDFWLAELAGFCRVIVMGKGVDAGLVPPQYTWGSMGAVDGATFAYLSTRKVSEGGAAREIGVCGYGPGSQDLLRRVIAQIRMWDRDMNGTADQLWVEVHPLDCPDLPPGHLRLRKRYNWVIVGRSEDGVRSGADPTGAIAHAVTGARDTLSM